ncbi:unnamed protein product, partial [Adineta ricciae]
SDTIFSSPIDLSAYNSTDNPQAILAHDVNDDGFIDLIVSRQPNYEKARSRVIVFVNYGNGYKFHWISVYLKIVMDDILSIVGGDFDNNGKQNEISFCSRNNALHTFSIDISLQVKSLPKYYMYKDPSILIKGKFNYDDREDLATISSQSNTLQILLGYLKGNFTQQIYLTSDFPTSISRINFNNDQIDDLALLHCNGTVTIFLGTKIGFFDKNYLSFHMDRIHNSKCFQSLKVIDLNQDGKDDLVFIDTEMNSIRVSLGAACH